MKFGRDYAEWDALTEAELDHVLKTFCLVNKHTPFHVAVIWFDPCQFSIVEKALETATSRRSTGTRPTGTSRSHYTFACLQLKSASLRTMARSPISRR